jgi:hypothetical protein
MRVVPAGRGKAVFAVDDVGRPAGGLADAALIAPALVIRLIHHHDAVGTIALDQPVELPALLRRNFPGDVEQLIEGVAVA